VGRGTSRASDSDSLAPGVPGLLINRARKRAREAREELGVAPEDPLPDVLRCVEAAGVGVAILDLGEGLAGAYLRPNGTPIAFVNGRDSPQRQRFTLAHEFGHHRLGHGRVVDEPRALGDFTGDPDEVQANYFAAAFLVPLPAAQAWVDEHETPPYSLDTVVRCAAAFGVSAQAACIALEHAGALPEALCPRLREEIGEGLHLGLAAHLGVAWPDDEIAAARDRLPRLPAGLRRNPLGDLLSGTITVEDLARQIDRDVASVRAALDATGLAALVP
jgi:Zn-dependent peptidase ImmA (M78 family)